jgi:hypothetical protein
LVGLCTKEENKVNNWKVSTTNPEYASALYVDKPTGEIEKIIGSASGKRFAWQDEVLDAQFTSTNQLRSRYFKLVAPCGGGKSSVQVSSAVLDVVGSRYGRKQLFVMPQCHIADGFFKQGGCYTSLEIRGKVYQVAVLDNLNFCEKSSIKRLKEWLLADPKTLAKYCNPKKRYIAGLLAMTSNHALAIAFKELLEESPRKVKQVFHDLHLRLDESHHLAMGSDDIENPTEEEMLEVKDSNSLGEIVKHLVKYDNGTSALTLSTATDFRSDGKPILHDSIRGEFLSYHRDFAEHFKTLGISQFDLEIAQFKTNPIKEVIKTVAKERAEYHYIAVPPCNVSWRKVFKEDTDWGVDLLVAGIRKAWPGVRILNLVPDEERKGKGGTKQLLLSEPKTPADGAPKFDVVLTCMLGREGTDWCPASRLHVLYAERSITLSVQTLGRLARRFKKGTSAVPWLNSRYNHNGQGKESINARYYYPEFPEPKSGLTKDEILDGRKNALLLMVQAEEQFLPVIFPDLPRKRKKGENRAESLAELLGHEKHAALLQDFTEEVAEQGARGISLESFNRMVDGLLEDHGVPEEYSEDARDTLRTLYLRRANLNFKGISIAFVREQGFPKLWERVKDKSLVFGHSVKNIKLLRKIMQGEWDRMFELAQKEGLQSKDTRLQKWFKRMRWEARKLKGDQ